MMCVCEALISPPVYVPSVDYRLCSMKHLNLNIGHSAFSFGTVGGSQGYCFGPI